MLELLSNAVHYETFENVFSFLLKHIIVYCKCFLKNTVMLLINGKKWDFKGAVCTFLLLLQCQSLQ